jgi:hypothetical protein
MSAHIHVKKFMSGRMSPNELHRKLGIAMRCESCAAGGVEKPAAIRIMVWGEIEEVMRRQLALSVAAYWASQGCGLPRRKTLLGDFVMISDNGFCDLCKGRAEQLTARQAKSWMLVEVDRGPEHTNPFSAQVPTALSYL